MADVDGSDRIVGSRLHRIVFLAPHEGILQNGGAVPAGRSGAHSNACHARALSRRATGRAGQRHGAMESGQSLPASGRDRCRASRHRQHRRLLSDRLCRPDRICLHCAWRAHAERAARRHDHAVVRQRQDGPRAERPERARSQPAQQRAARQRVRRPRAVLDLSHSCDGRLQFAAGAVKAGSLRARACGCRWRSGHSPRLPIASDH